MASSLKGAALEVFLQLDSAVMGSYYRLAKVLQQGYGKRYQNKIFRAQIIITASDNVDISVRKWPQEFDDKISWEA